MSIATRQNIYTSRQVCEYLGITFEALRSAEREGRIPEAPREIGGDDRTFTPELVAVLRDYFGGPPGTA